MCGIFGGFGSDNAWETKRDFGVILKHRGPDDFGFYSDSLGCLGNTRLAVQDVTNGGQPFYASDQSVVVTQNGEIYNYLELREELRKLGHHFETSCDTEVILKSYLEFGISFVEKLNGMFAIAIYDRRTSSLHLIRDRLGVKPLFFLESQGSFYFGSEIKILFPLSGTSPKIDCDSLSDFFSYNYVPPPKTMFQGVRHVIPGSILSITESGLKESKWWDVSDMCVEYFEYTDSWGDRFNEILDDATRIRCRADVPVGAFLSGGLDSTSVLASYRANMDNDLTCFCIGFENSKYNEIPFAEEAAKKFGVSLQTRLVSEDLLDRWSRATYFSDQPHGDISFLPTWVVSELASKSVKVVLTGDGGDELFGGYDKYLKFYDKSFLSETRGDNFLERYWPCLTLFSNEEKNQLFRGRCFSATDPKDRLNQIIKENKHHDFINQMLLIDLNLLLPGNNLVKPDRMGMAASVEARSPYLDYRMVEFAFKTSGFMKLESRQTKSCVKKALSSRLGAKLTYRKKQMFTVPVGDWFKNTRRAYCQNHLNALKETGWVNPEFIDLVFEQHLANRVNRTRELRALISLQLWRDEFSVL